MRAKKLFSSTDDLAKSKRYVAALVILQCKAPVHYSVLIRTEVIWTDALPTAGTDGVYVYVNPSFFRGLGSDSQRAFLLAHEVSHIILRHPIRGKMYTDRGCFRGGKRWDAGLYNVAADYIINSDCIAMGLEPIPEGCYSDAYGRNDIADNVYADLLRDSDDQDGDDQGDDDQDSDDQDGDDQGDDQDGDDQGDDDGSEGGSEGDDDSEGDDTSEGDDGSEGGSGAPQPNGPRAGHDDHFSPEYEGDAEQQRADQAEDQHQIGNAIDDGIDEAERQGRAVSGGIAEQGARAQAGDKSDISWQEELQDMLRQVGSNGKVTWSQIKRRRFAMLGVVSPERRGELQRLSVIVDISGSVDRQRLNAFMVELAAAIDELQPSDGVLVVFTNHEYHSHAEVYSGGELLDLDIPMGGGTHMEAGVRWLESTGLESDVVFCFTDGDLYDNDWQVLADSDVVVVTDRVLYSCDQRNADNAGARVIVAEAA